MEEFLINLNQIVVVYSLAAFVDMYHLGVVCVLLVDLRSLPKLWRRNLLKSCVHKNLRTLFLKKKVTLID